MKVQLITTQMGDWTALYKDGKLMEEGDSEHYSEYPFNSFKTLWRDMYGIPVGTPVSIHYLLNVTDDMMIGELGGFPAQLSTFRGEY